MRTLNALPVETLLPHALGPVPRAIARGGWKEHGSCRQIDPDLWFAESSRRIHARASSICEDCPVRRACLTWALVFHEQFGVWGGLSPGERRPLWRRLAAGESLLAVTVDALASEPVGGEIA